jgi:methionine synthase I (cobalamin-dependent)
VTADESVYERLFAGGVVLCDGAMGTVLCDRGISIDRCLEELNLSRPEMVAAVHSEYLRAGAEIVETNTFGANAIRLERFGLREKVREINLAGVRIACDCAAQMTGSEVLVAGAVGPLGVRIGVEEACDVFAEQIGGLADGGVDLLLVETMMSLAEARAAIRAAREIVPGLRLVVMMTVDAAGNCLDGATPEMAAEQLTDLGADAVGCNCSDGPESVLRAIERMRAVTHLPLAAMPNAGLPRNVGGRNVYAVSPEEMAEFAGRAIGAGASLIGGCCGTSPEHTRAMRLVVPV